MSLRKKLFMLAAVLCGGALTLNFATAPLAHSAEAPTRVGAGSFDMHTPIPYQPCNGDRYAVGQVVTFQWSAIAQAQAYVVKFSATDSVVTSSNFTTWTPEESDVGNYQWNVYSIGSWGKSAVSSVCTWFVEVP